MLVVAKFADLDKKEPVYVFKIVSLFVVKGSETEVERKCQGHWMKLKWFTSNPRTTGKYGLMKGYDSENVPLGVDWEGMPAPILVHWNDGDTLPVLTRSRHMTKQVRDLVIKDCRFQANGVATMFKKLWDGKGKGGQNGKKPELQEEESSSE